jgi:hypothetical protein
MTPLRGQNQEAQPFFLSRDKLRDRSPEHSTGVTNVQFRDKQRERSGAASGIRCYLSLRKDNTAGSAFHTAWSTLKAQLMP